MDSVGLVEISLGEEVEHAYLVQWTILSCWEPLGVVDLRVMGYYSCLGYAGSRFHRSSTGLGGTFR